MITKFGNFCKLRCLFQNCRAKLLLPFNVGVSSMELFERRDKLCEQVENYVVKLPRQSSQHIIFIPAAELQYMAYHVPYPFHQDSNFFYFTGLSEPNAVLVMIIEFISDTNSIFRRSSFSSHLFMDIGNPHAEIWDGPRMSPLDASRISGITSSHSLSSLCEFIQERLFLKVPLSLWYSVLACRKSETRPINRSVLSTILRFREEFEKHKVSFLNPDPLIDNLRYVKSDFEIKQLKSAAKVTLETVASAMAISYPGISESTLHNHIDYEARSRGSFLSYPPVVAGGQRTNIIHYLKNNQTINDGELVLMDVGCRINGYTSDITRSWPVSGYFSPTQKVVHDILVEVQKSCVQLASPERSLQDLHQHMLSQLGLHLSNEHIIPSDNKELVVQKLCPHYVGHYLGLDVHDTPTIPYSRLLQPGSVFPLEPGLYFRDEIRPFIIRKEFLGIGLRIEDDFVLMANGNTQLLSDLLPSETSLLEKIIRNGTTSLCNAALPL